MRAQGFDIIIQARMSSERLPGKTLMKIRGKSLLDYQLERLKTVSGIRQIIVATSDDRSDDPIEEHCESLKTPCYRGCLHKVSQRFYDCLKIHEPDAFIRFCADRPYYDVSLLSHALDLYKESTPDIVSNVFESSFPKGQTTEIIKTESYLSAAPHFKTKEHQEHVTRYFYDYASDFTLLNFSCPEGDFQNINHCIDTNDDLLRFERFLDKGFNPNQSWKLTTEQLLELES